MKRVLSAFVALAISSAQSFAAGAYTDGPTSEWFKSLSVPNDTRNCCDQSDCKQADSDYRDGSWWALSNRTHTWVRIDPSQITSDVSIFNNAVLCEGAPIWDAPEAAYAPTVFCFAPAPHGF